MKISRTVTDNKTAFQLKANHPRVYISLGSYDLDLDPMTSILYLDLDILKAYRRTEMKFTCQGFKKIELKKYKQTQK